MNIKYYARKVKDIHVLDFFSVFPMILARIVSLFVKGKYENTWAICERKDEARDNGYWFFKYMCEHHPEQPCIYVIQRGCSDEQKVRGLGKTAPYGGISHWILYFCCRYLISSQSFAPNGYLCAALERSGVIQTRQVFLQHGITKDVAEFLLASHRKVKYFIAGAEPEYRFMKEQFGYAEGVIQYTGFPRFDALHDYQTVQNRILIMPTWRKWLVRKSEEHADAKRDEHIAEYVEGWQRLLTDATFLKMVQENQLEILFYLHPNMKGILDRTVFSSAKITVIDPEESDIQELLKSSQMLITDYSSVFFDMAYMRKPIVFYQFDEEKYRKYHYQQGWFDYHHTALGESCKTTEAVCQSVQTVIERKYRVSDEFIHEHRMIFPKYDTENCRRLYDVLQ